MKNLKPVLWIVIGLVAGAAGVSAMHPTAPQQKPVPRLQIINAGPVQGSFATFIKDEKSGGCWLALGWAAAEMTLAPAPKEACD